MVAQAEFHTKQRGKELASAANRGVIFYTPRTLRRNSRVRGWDG